MNFLAHTWLAGPAEGDRLGALLGDFVSGPLNAPPLNALPPEVLAGIALHRHIDSSLDTTPAFMRSRARISASHRRVAGIMVDVFYDHFLAAHWPYFDNRPLEDYAQGVYDMLDANTSLLPERLAQVRHFMRTDNWLVSYREQNTVAIVLDRIGQRLSRPQLMDGAARELAVHYTAFEADFFEAMAAMVEVVGQWQHRSRGVAKNVTTL